MGHQLGQPGGQATEDREQALLAEAHAQADSSKMARGSQAGPLDQQASDDAECRDRHGPGRVLRWKLQQGWGRSALDWAADPGDAVLAGESDDGRSDAR